MSSKIQRIKLGLQLANLRFNTAMLTMDANYPKDPDPKNWRTINGSKVHLTNGKIDGGAGGKFKGKKWVGKQHHQFVPAPNKIYSPTPGKQFSKAAQGHLDKLDQILKQSAKGKGKPTYYQGQIDKEEKALSALEKINQLYEQKHSESETTPATAKTSKLPALKELSDKNPQLADYIKNLAQYIDLNKGSINIGQAMPLIDQAYKGSIYAPKGLHDMGVKWNDFYEKCEEALHEQINTFQFVESVAQMAIGNENPKSIKALEGVKSLISEKPSKIAETNESSSPSKSLVKPNSKNKAAVYDFKNTGIKVQGGTVLPMEASKADSKIPSSATEIFKYKYGVPECMKLDDHQKNSIIRYTTGSLHLRNWIVYEKADPWYADYYYENGMTGEALQKTADNISAGLAKMKHPNMFVVRKCSLKDWANKKNKAGATFQDLVKMQKEGTVFTNEAFLSTTINDKARTSKWGYGKNELCRLIYVPKKASGGYIASISDHPTELEFLLDKGTKTRIMKVEKGEDGRIYTFEEVVLDE